jgi:ABC-type transport system substrate-binding protein
MSRQYFAFVNKKVAEASPNKDVQDGPKGAGSGAYLLEKRDATGTRLVRNPDYYKHEPAMDGFTGSGPYIDVVETRVIADLAAQKAAFLSGDVDVFGGIDPLEVDDFKKNDKIYVAEAPNAAFLILAFDHKKLFDRRARQALRLAVNYEAFGASIFGGKFQYPAPVNVVLTGFQPWDQAKIKSYYKYDPAEAKKLWEAAGKPVDTIRILTGNDGQRGVVISDFAKQSISQALGVNVVVEQVDSQTWAQRANRVPDKDWELLQSGQGIAGPTSGVPEDSSLIWFDWRAYMPLAFNADLNRDDINAELKADGQKLLDMMKKQEQELDVNVRKQTLAEIQQFIYDNALTGIMLPVAAKQNLGFSKRMQDVNYADWPHYYAYRRQSVWLKG